MEEYGADAVYVMDSAGAMLPSDVRDRVGLLADELSIDVGFHAHGNLGLGAGSGNAQMGCWSSARRTSSPTSSHTSPTNGTRPPSPTTGPSPVPGIRHPPYVSIYTLYQRILEGYAFTLVYLDT
nr:hypothetical protein [Halomicroarcula sp. XH51]